MKWLSMLGLILGMAGVLVLFVWAFPQPSFDRGAGIGLEDNTMLSTGKTVAQNNADIVALEQKYRCRSQVGLALVGIGFLLQFLGVCLDK